MKVSVIIPAYNAAQFIEKSYFSIINQELTDFEIIYVDNNSTDNTRQEIEKVMALDHRVKLLLQTKQGAAAARNLGIKAAQGDYIYVFDVDDEIYPDALKCMINVLDGYQNIDAVFGKMVKSSKGIILTPKPSDETGEVIFKDKPFWGLHWFSSLKNVVGPPAFLYRARVFDKIGYYNESIRINEDTAFDIKLGMLCAIAFLDQYVYLYFKHDTSTIQSSKRQMPRAFMVWPRLVKEHLPFYLEYETPKRFKKLLYSQIFQCMGRQVHYTHGFKQRIKLKKQLINDVHLLKIPVVIKLYLFLMALIPLDVVKKFYSYYLVPLTVKCLQ